MLSGIFIFVKIWKLQFLPKFWMLCQNFVNIQSFGLKFSRNFPWNIDEIVNAVTLPKNLLTLYYCIKLHRRQESAKMKPFRMVCCRFSYPGSECSRISAEVEECRVRSSVEFHEHMSARLKDNPYPSDVTTLRYRCRNYPSSVSCLFYIPRFQKIEKNTKCYLSFNCWYYTN